MEPSNRCLNHPKTSIEKVKVYFKCGCWEYQMPAQCYECRDAFLLRTKKTPYRRTFCSKVCKDAFHAKQPSRLVYKAEWAREDRRKKREAKAKA